MNKNRIKLEQIGFFSKYVIGCILTFLLIFALYILSNIILEKHSKNPPVIEISIFQNNKKNVELSEQISKRVKDEILSDIKLRYEETISLINLTIDIFAISATLFLALIGFFSYNQIKKIIEETKEVLDRTETLPERIIKKYNEQQVTILLNKIFSDNILERSDILQKLYTNPEVKIEHYNIILQALEKELGEKQNSYFYSNIHYLSNLLIKLDQYKAKENIFNLIKSRSGDRRISNLLTLYINLHEKNDENKLQSMLLDDDINFGYSLISSLVNTGKLNNNYIQFILNNCNDQLCSHLLAHLNQFPDLFDENIITESLLKNIRKNLLVVILSGKLNEKLSLNSKNKLIKKYLQKIENLEEIIPLLLAHLNKIDEDEKAIEDFMQIVIDMHNSKEIFDRLTPLLRARRSPIVGIFENKLREYLK